MRQPAMELQRLRRPGDLFVKASLGMSVELTGSAALWAFAPRVEQGGRVAEWLMAADCKSARESVHWFESSPFHHLFLLRKEANSRSSFVRQAN